MTQTANDQIGTIGWVDLTVPDADKIKDFYSRVVGWMSASVSMGEYNDFNMLHPQTGAPTVGICHARGVNADLPAQWLLYVAVENLDNSVASCVELGGKVLVAPKSFGSDARFCVIEDPAGAVIALAENVTPTSAE